MQGTSRVRQPSFLGSLPPRNSLQEAWRGFPPGHSPGRPTLGQHSPPGFPSLVLVGTARRSFLQKHFRPPAGSRSAH